MADDHEKWEREAFNRKEITQTKAIAALLWDSLKRDPEHKDRRQTGAGTKTKLGLLRTIEHTLRTNGAVIT